MQLGFYKYRSANKQWKPEARIIVAHYSERLAREMAENTVNGVLSLDRFLAKTYADVPYIKSNTF